GEYLEILAGARGSGPVDSLRWGSALSRVSRLTDIPVEELNRRFRSSKSKTAASAKPQAAQVAGEGEPTNTARAVGKPLSGLDRSERRILGSLLAEPHHWHDVQQSVHPADFSDELRRKLAELYWGHQRD